MRRITTNPPFSQWISRRHFLAAVSSGVAVITFPTEATEDSRSEATTRLNAWLESRFDGWVARSPMQQGYLGLSTNLDKWDNISEVHYLEDVARSRKELADLRGNFKPATLTSDGQLSHRLYEYESEQRTSRAEWRYHDHPVNQMFGWQQKIPSFLINIHRIRSKEDAEAYISRLRGMGTIIDQVLYWMRVGQEADVHAPRFVYAAVLRDCRNIITGVPFDNNGLSPLWTDITAKVEALKIDAPAKQKLQVKGSGRYGKSLGRRSSSSWLCARSRRGLQPPPTEYGSCRAEISITHTFCGITRLQI